MNNPGVRDRLPTIISVMEQYSRQDIKIFQVGKMVKDMSVKCPEILRLLLPHNFSDAEWEERLAKQSYV